MKASLIIALTSSFIFASCSNDNTTSSTDKDSSTSSTSATPNDVQDSAVKDNVVPGYLSLKNALANDNPSEAADAAKQITESLAKMDQAFLTTDEKKIYDEVKSDIKEHAEHIIGNGSNIKHQREHFELLSKDIIDLVKVTGSSKDLFLTYCPMYNDKKGAFWLSESKEIKNPYYGKEMSKCGEVKEEIKSKQ